MNSTLSGIAAAMWLGGLWYAAPLLSFDDETADRPARRLRDAILLGVGIPLVLAAMSLLAQATCVVALSAVAVMRTVRRPPQLPSVRQSQSSVPLEAIIGRALPTVTVVLAAWPALVRPITQGDSLGYHLPNAASWSTTHSLFTTNTSYWWYPGGSELFAAGVFTVAGPLAVGLSGTVAALMLAHRLYAFARQAGFAPIASGSLVAATVSLPIIALQSGSLENDVWLTTWVLEVVWTIRYERQAIARALGICGLTKPYGFIFAALAALLGHARPRAIFLGFAPLALWLLRDTLLWHTATIKPSRLAYPHLESTTIAAQGFSGIATLGAALWAQGLGTIIASVALLTTLVFARDALVRYTALGAVAFFFIEPFGFRNDVPQLATGASLRFALPAIAFGLVGVLPMIRRFATPLSPVFLALAAYQVRGVIAIFDNDSTTRGVYMVALALGVASIVPYRFVRIAATACLSLVLIAYAVRLAGTHPLDYYNEAIRHGHERSGLFTWLATARPSAAVGYQLRIGAISVASPHTIVYDATGLTSCAEARHAHAVLIIADDPRTDGEAFARRRAFGRKCGAKLYEDAFALVVLPAAINGGL